MYARLHQQYQTYCCCVGLLITLGLLARQSVILNISVVYLVPLRDDCLPRDLLFLFYFVPHCSPVSVSVLVLICIALPLPPHPHYLSLCIRRLMRVPLQYFILSHHLIVQTYSRPGKLSFIRAAKFISGLQNVWYAFMKSKVLEYHNINISKLHKPSFGILWNRNIQMNFTIYLSGNFAPAVSSISVVTSILLVGHPNTFRLR